MTFAVKARAIIGWLLVMFCSSNALAYSGVDECKLMREAIQSNLGPLQLDEAFISESSNFGLDFFFTHEDDPEETRLQIIKVYPQIYAELEAKGVDPSSLEAIYPYKINGKLSKDFKKLDLEKSHESRTLEIQATPDSDPIEFAKRDFSLIKSDALWVLFDNIDDISTKDESFFAKFRVISQWSDGRLAKFGQKLLRSLKLQTLMVLRNTKDSSIAQIPKNS